MKEVIFPYQEGREYYEIEIEGLKRRLPLLRVSEDTWIAYFDSLGDREFISKCAEKLSEKLRGSDILITSESKGIPLVHEIAKILDHKRYIVARKELKPFMVNPLVAECRPVTSKAPIKLCIDGRYVPYIKDKSVGIVDDIVSTRETMSALEKLVVMAGGRVYKKVAILLEGGVYDDVEYLGILPIFKKTV
ncbi:MAG: adenine phosphoribosyltransferase [Nitrososphaerota archaeon]